MSEIRHPGAPENDAEAYRSPDPPRAARHTPEAPPGGPQRPAQAPRAPLGSLYGRDPRYKLPILATILSLIPGLGQVYVGLYVRGFTHAIIVAVLITFLANTHADEMIPLASLFMVFFWLYNVIDAFRQATMYNQALEGGRLDEPEIRATAFRGSIAGGAALVIVGSVFLVHTAFDVPLEWIEDWWPLAPILLGVFLIARAIQDRASKDRDRG